MLMHPGVADSDSLAAAASGRVLGPDDLIFLD
jgi:hypothetical protein